MEMILAIQCLNGGAGFVEEDGKVSYEYPREIKRPAFAFEKAKPSTMPVHFISIILPYSGLKAPKIYLQENPGNDHHTGKSI